MEVINIIEVENNQITGLASFAVIDPQEDSAIVQEAENCFAETLRQRGVFDFAIERAIEDGYHEHENLGIKYSLSLMWSSIDI